MRTPSPLTVAEAAYLRTVTALAAQILKVMQAPNHGFFSSERALRQWLINGGVSLTPVDEQVARWRNIDKMITQGNCS